MDHPEHLGKPVIVGARPGQRGVVSACSYEARKFGIHSAMPISIAQRKCPGGVFLPVRMQRYLEISGVVMGILQDYTPSFQQISVDEAFLDLSGTEKLFGPPLKVAEQIKLRVKRETGLNLSIGMAPNKYLAKLASEYAKPNGIYRVEPGKEERFLDRLELKDLWGIGKKTLGRLHELNIRSVATMRQFPEDILISMLGESTGSFLYRAVRGENPGIHTESPKSRSLSNEITFHTDTTDQRHLNNVLLELAHQVMFRLINSQAEARTVQIKIRYQDFTTITLRKTFKHLVYSAEEIFATARELFYGKWDRHTPIRLIGLGLAGISDKPEHIQQELFEDTNSKKNKVEQAVFRINRKLEGKGVRKASLLDSRKRGKEARG